MSTDTPDRHHRRLCCDSETWDGHQPDCPLAPERRQPLREPSSIPGVPRGER